MPKGEISGTITYKGKTLKVHGTGYHDHQWGTMNPANFNNWLWGRQHFEDYTILMFDVITSRKYGYERCPHFCIEDKEGNVVFDNCSCDDGFGTKIQEEYLEEDIQKKYPQRILYTFAHDGKRVEYALSVKHPILTQDIYHSGNKVMQMIMKMLHISPAYVRYKANGMMNLTLGNEKIQRSGELIYEFAYIGNEYRRHMETV